MFRKLLLSSLASLGLLAAVVAPTQAHPYHGHSVHHARHVHAWHHREFCSLAEANFWVRAHHGCEVRFEWHGPHVWVYYR